MANVTIELTEQQRAVLTDIIEFYQTNQSFSQTDKTQEQVINDLWWAVTQAV